MSEKATHLSRHGVKQIIEDFDSLRESSLELQVIDVFKLDENKKKNMKARVTLSDGVSKIFAFVLNKAYDQIVCVISL